MKRDDHEILTTIDSRPVSVFKRQQTFLTPLFMQTDAGDVCSSRQQMTWDFMIHFQLKSRKAGVLK